MRVGLPLDVACLGGVADLGLRDDQGTELELRMVIGCDLGLVRDFGRKVNCLGAARRGLIADLLLARSFTSR